MSNKITSDVILTPEGKILRDTGMCTCATHCANSPYHEKACCYEIWCNCWCHKADYLKKQADCDHSGFKGDNYGETCTHCGKILAGYGAFAVGSPRICIHRYDKYNGNICIFCEQTKPIKNPALLNEKYPAEISLRKRLSRLYADILFMQKINPDHSGIITMMVIKDEMKKQLQSFQN